jgi:two-component system nitrogen regulation sensor histidine kinase NtrY
VEKDRLQKRSRISPWILGISVLVLLTFLILLQTSNLWKDFSVDTASDTLLLYALSSLNFIAFVIFGFIFLRSIIKLARERRAFQLGARIKTRLLLYFAAISLLPIIAMAGFSYLFMNRALERWFIQIPENVVRLPREVENQALQLQSKKLHETAQMLSAVLEKSDVKSVDLKAIADAGNMTLIEVISKDNKVLEHIERPLPADQKAELDRVLVGIRSGSLIDAALQDGRGFDAAVVNLADGRKLLVVPDSAEDKGIGQMVDSSLSEFDRLKDQQIVVRQVGFLTLGVLTFLLIFASSWTAFYIARGLTVPIKALAVGADEIAQGNLSHRVEVFAEDELALLVTTFNQMSAKLEENSTELNEGRRYIETVLQSLPTGVISFDSDGRVSTINRAAINILKLEDADFRQLTLDQLVNAENKIVLERLISRAKRIGRASEQTTLQRENANGSSDAEASMPVALTASALPDESGAVLVIEDLSELISAQRAAAWQEVARRMAHEIKNPLTPIQLSAERIAKRFAAAGERASVGEIKPFGVAGESVIGFDQTAKVVQDGTETILREVQSLKSMVDEFSRFARLPDAQLEKSGLNEVIEQVVALYDGRDDNVRIETELAPDLPQAMLDNEQIKRVFVNLIENSIEAFDPLQEEKIVTVRSRYENARDLILAEVADNGNGIPLSDLQKLFQPYFSTKGRGTGIGLAIVRRIVTEHNGAIKVVANQPKGAKFIIEVPVAG